jgi:CubicO group peptidase (beta-lactamase class C family)
MCWNRPVDRSRTSGEAAADTPPDELDRLVADAVGEHHLPGVSVVVETRGTRLYERHVGFADTRSKRELTLDTAFRIGSVTKTFTALAVVQLCAEGRLDLDAPVSEYLTAFRIEGPSPDALPITIRQLLAHTSGIGVLRKMTDLFRPMSGLAAPVGEEPSLLADYYGGRLKAELEPCRAWIYTNHGYAALGQVIEDITGGPLDDYMHANVFRPLGMLATTLSIDDAQRARLATGYASRRGRFSPVEFREVIVRAAGAVVSTPDDLARYLHTLLGEGENESGRVLARERFVQMLEPQVQLHPALPGMGIGFALKRLGQHRIAWHNGAWIGFASTLLVAPDRDLGVAIVTNTRTLALDRLGWAILRLLLGVDRLDDGDDIRERSRSSERDDLAGVYEPTPRLHGKQRLRAGMPRALVVREKSGQLTLRSRLSGASRRLYPVPGESPLIFHFEQDGEIETVVFGTDERGNVDSLCLGLHRFRKTR